MQLVRPRKLKEVARPILIHDHVNLDAHQLLVAELHRSDVIPPKALQLISDDEQRAIPAIAKNEFVELLNSNPDVSHIFIKLLANEVTERESQLLHIAYNSPRFGAKSEFLLHEAISLLLQGFPKQETLAGLWFLG